MKTMMSAAVLAGALSFAASGCDGGGASALDAPLDDVEVAATEQALTGLYLCTAEMAAHSCYGSPAYIGRCGVYQYCYENSYCVVGDTGVGNYIVVPCATGGTQ